MEKQKKEKIEKKLEQEANKIAVENQRLEREPRQTATQE